jgi:hypothetical protein
MRPFGPRAGGRAQDPKPATAEPADENTAASGVCGVTIVKAR